MADTMTGTIAAAMTECEAAAREQGWEGDWHPLPADLEYAADQAKATHGRYPTVAEWEDAGYKVFRNGAYCADETTTAAVVLGRRGGARATEAQKAAARRNAKKGGRPRKALEAMTMTNTMTRTNTDDTRCSICRRHLPIAIDETDPTADELTVDARGVVRPGAYVCGACLDAAEDELAARAATASSARSACR